MNSKTLRKALFCTVVAGMVIGAFFLGSSTSSQRHAVTEATLAQAQYMNLALIKKSDLAAQMALARYYFWISKLPPAEYDTLIFDYGPVEQELLRGIPITKEKPYDANQDYFRL